MKEETLKRDKQSDLYFDGLEVGAISVKWVCRTQERETTARAIQHGGNPKKKLKIILEVIEEGKDPRIVITGQATRGLLDLPYRSETECIEKAMDFYGLKPDILLALGGETFSVYPMKDGMIKNIISSSKCAAGTGEFIVQQFQRMDMSLSEGLEASLEGEIVQLATRCSVHCKSDATHKLNKGECEPGDIARSLIFDLAKKISEMVELAKWPIRSIVISGGVAKNKLFVENLCEIFNESDVALVPESHCLEAFGASLFAQELSNTISSKEKWIIASGTEFETLKPLIKAESLLDYRVKTRNKNKIIDGASYILGLDAGSTTTKAVLMNIEDGSIAASCYLRTLGNPILATKNCLNELINQVGDKPVNIIQTGVTGSGREMVSVYLDNCLSFNEILAHARAAAQEVPNVDTVFEIGGQDSKFISFLEGIPIDYAMNEGCSAGTGSFLEESASVDMGITTKEISSIAEGSQNPIAFGERCAAFINTDLRNALQQGAGQDGVVAGLVYSIADNYISRILGSRNVGDNLLFQGGVALNRSVALAMAARIQRKVVVPSHPELMGCVGTALMALDLLEDGTAVEKVYQLKRLVDGEMAVQGTFNCKSCDNHCEIQKIAIRGKAYPFGGLCSKFEILRHKSNKTKEGSDLVSVRNQIMFESFGPKEVATPRGTIGLPMALTAYELFPFYSKLINELGYNIVLSNPSKIGNTKTNSSICYPGEIAHGAVYDLMKRNVDFIFLPRVIELEVPPGCLHSYTCPSTASIADLIHAAFVNTKGKVLSPHIALSKNHINTTLKEIEKIGSVLGLSKPAARNAGEKAISYYRAFQHTYIEQGKKDLETLIKEPTVIIAGRPYSVCSSEVNLALPRKIISRGYHVIPADMLPQLNNVSNARDEWHFTQQISNAVAHAKKNPNLYIVLVSCFSCGPDSVMYHYIRQELSGQTFCYLEMDSHTAHAGFDTRIGAFLDIIEERSRKMR